MHSIEYNKYNSPFIYYLQDKTQHKFRCEANSHQTKDTSRRGPQKEKTTTNSKRVDKIQRINASDNTYTHMDTSHDKRRSLL